jgi:D-alanyl-D-alanine-carboxypeptidase/D-alanyl-D-alanine-endopeptidase
MSRLTGRILLAAVLMAARVATAPAATPAEPEIRQILVERIDQRRQGVGMVVGVIDSGGRRVVGYGVRGIDDPRPVDGDTVFEIGSTTKVFTALLLADMSRRGDVELTDPLAKHLPPDVRVPQRDGRQITLQDLATHTSGLPRLPTNLAPRDPANPYADYTARQLYDFLASYNLPREVGETYEYSNLGAGLLGLALAHRAGTDYETLVRTRITEPLGMDSTVVTLTDALRGRLASGHNERLELVPGWDIPTLAGAGALRSTANDLLTLLAATLGYTSSPLTASMAAMTAVRRPTGAPGLEVALGWQVASTDGGDLFWHNGGTGGYRSFLGFDQRRRVGVVVLSNTFTPAGVDDIGRHLLDTAMPLLPAEKVRQERTLEPTILERYVGRYAMGPAFVLTVTREANRLFVQATGQGRLELFAEGERDFFAKAVDAEITFELAGDGRATKLILHQGGLSQTARRLE